MRKLAGLSIALASLVAAVSPAQAQQAHLPIKPGIWVKTDTQCSATVMAYIYDRGRFGSVYFYGPGHSMGPANETEPLSRVSAGMNGFNVINDGPIEVAARANGQAVVRAVSLSEGVQWSETVRPCPLASLSARFQAGLTRLGLTGRP